MNTSAHREAMGLCPTSGGRIAQVRRPLVGDGGGDYIAKS
jgi:hypothetical protein